MGFRYRPNPELERKLALEAQGLLADERNAGMMPMPNTPRDPDDEKRRQDQFKRFLAGGGGPGFGLPNARPIYLPGQNPFETTPTPTVDQMAEVRAAAEFSKAPKPVIPASAELAGTSIPNSQFDPLGQDDQIAVQETDDYDRFNPSAPTIERAGKELRVDRPSDLPGTEDNPKPMLPEDLASNPGQGSLRDQILARIASPQAKAPGPQIDPSYIDAIKQTGNTNRDLGFMSLLARSANQAGTLGGKFADSSGIEEQTANLVSSNNQGLGMLKDAENRRLSSKAAASNDPTKLMLELLKLQQSREIADQSNDTRRDYNDVMGGVRKSEVEGRLENQSVLNEIRRDANDIKRNPTARPLTELERLELERAEQGLDRYGNKVLPKDPNKKTTEQTSIRDRSAQKAGQEWLDSGAQKAASTIATLDDVIQQLGSTTTATGPAINLVPDFAKTALGWKGPELKQQAEAAIQSTIKEILGGAPSERETFGVLQRAFDPSQPEAVNVKKLTMISEGLKQIAKEKEAMIDFMDANEGSIKGYNRPNFEARIQALLKTAQDLRTGETKDKGTSKEAPPGMKWQVNTKTGERRLVPK